MGAYGTGRIVAFASSLIAGGLLCLVILSLLTVATIVLSLIPLYTSNNAVEGYGEHYQINTLLIKALYQNVSFTFANGIVVDSIAISTACGSIYRNQGAKNFAGCVATKFRAFGPYNISSRSKRRRRVTIPDVGLYEFGEIDLYYSTTCSSKGDQLQYANSTGLSSCAKSRLTACNNLVNGSSQNNEWPLLSGSFLQMVDAGQGAGYQTIIVDHLFGFSFSTASSVASSLNLNTTIKANILSGCRYIGPLSQEQIAVALNSQAIITTTQPTSSSPMI